jgi:translation initiation factor 1
MEDNDLNSRLVYSTSVGSVCSACSQPVKNCVCHQMKKKTLPQTDGEARLSYEISGRKGKGVTLITGLPLGKEGLLALAKQLKSQFGTGGSLKDNVIELQGDQREKAAVELRKLRYYVIIKRS